MVETSSTIVSKIYLFMYLKMSELDYALLLSII